MPRKFTPWDGVAVTGTVVSAAGDARSASHARGVASALSARAGSARSPSYASAQVLGEDIELLAGQSIQLLTGVENVIDLNQLVASGVANGWAIENLPAWASLNTETGILTLTPPADGSTGVFVVASDDDSEDAETQMRFNATGVEWGTRWDTDTDLYGPSRYEPDSSSTFYNAYVKSGTFEPGITTTISRQVGRGIAGRNCLRLLYPAALAANPGSWNRLFRDGLNTWPLDTPLYVEFSLMIETTTFNFAGVPGAPTNWKYALLAGWGKTGWGNTNQNREIVIWNAPNKSLWALTYNDPMLIEDFPGGGDYRAQNLRDAGPSQTNPQLRYVLYPNYYNVDQGGIGLSLRPNVWNTVYQRVVSRSNGNLDYRLELQYQGQSTRTPVWDYTNYDPISVGGSPNAWGTSGPFNTITFDIQTTDRESPAGIDLFFEVGECIVSGAPIPPRTKWT